ncbi:MAG: DUF2088 domain-containing protein [Acidobacteria bacterium]|nr:DUF2088 domain-containing protein [Acidobacteriota bacterium]
MSTNGTNSLSRLRRIERVAPSVPGLNDLAGDIHSALAALGLDSTCLRGKTIAVSAGSRGIASFRDIVRAVCAWLKAQGATPFVFPAMGSHGGATGEGQRKILKEYGVTPEFVGAEIRSAMETVAVGKAAQGYQSYMDRNAWESDGVVVINRIKPHTDFSGQIESGILKMIAVGMGKEDGARETHRWARKFGFEQVIRSMSGVALGSGKILCCLGVMENEFHEICAVRAARPAELPAVEEEALKLARTLVPRLPFAKLQLLVVDELGKNISGCGMDTKVIGRGTELQPGEAPDIQAIYVRDVTHESGGNAIGMGLADVMHERLFRKIDFQKTYLNSTVALNPAPAKMPLYVPTDRAALELMLGHLGRPGQEELRMAWIRNTLSLGRIAVSEVLAREAAALPGWRVLPEPAEIQFDPNGNLPSYI